MPLKGQESYKLTITRELEKKIRFLCEKLPKNEWSGTLFYTVEGSFAKKDLHVICKDLFLQDVGSSVYTEYSENVDLAAYMTSHDELLDCYIGNVHSHHVMTTNFSGTDMNTLLKEGIDRNHFLSLIVNNSKQYSAKITRKLTCTSKGVNTTRYNTFNDVPVEDESSDFENEETYVEYYNLDITIEDVPQAPKSELELRLEEIKANANSYINKGKNPVIPTTTNIYNPVHIETPATKVERRNPQQLSLWEDAEESETVRKNPDNKEQLNETIELDMSIAYDYDHVNPNIVLNTVAQVITGDIFSIYKSNIDLNRWVNNMVRLYDKRFKNSNVENDAFDYWVDSFVDFLENELHDDYLSDKGRDYIDAIWAYDVIVKLQDYPSNKYLDAFVKSFERWLI